MKHKKIHKKILIPIVIILVIACVLVIMLRHIPHRYQVISLDGEPKGIYSSPYSSELTVVYDDKLVLYNEFGDKKEYNLELAVAYMESLGDCVWVIDDEGNMHKLTYVSDTELEVSDVILSDVTYIDAVPDAFGAVTASGELYVYGDNECGWLGIEGENYISEPTKVDYIKDVTKFVFWNGMSSLLTTQGKVYSAGRIDAYDLNNEYYSKSIYVFTKDEALEDVKDIYGYDYLYSICEDGDIVCSYGYSYSESDNEYTFHINQDISDICIENGMIFFTDGMKYTLGMNDKGEVYYWGFDFLHVPKDKSDDAFWKSTPVRFTELDGVEMVYGAMDVAYLKKDIDIYIIK